MCLKDCPAVPQAPNATKVRITLAPNQSDSTVLVGKNPVPSKGGVWSPAEVWVPKRERCKPPPARPRNGRATAVCKHGLVVADLRSLLWFFVAVGATDIHVKVTAPDRKTTQGYTLRLGSAVGGANAADADYWQRFWGCVAPPRLPFASLIANLPGRSSFMLTTKRCAFRSCKAGIHRNGPCGLFWLVVVAAGVVVLMSTGFAWMRRRTRRTHQPQSSS